MGCYRGECFRQVLKLNWIAKVEVAAEHKGLLEGGEGITLWAKPGE